MFPDTFAVNIVTQKTVTLPDNLAVNLVMQKMVKLSDTLTVNIAAQKTVTNENPVLERRKPDGSMPEMLRSSRKGLPALQRGPYGIATRPPPHDDNGPVAPSGGPYGRTNPDISARKSGFSAF